jgi:DNA-binding MarR family transcriptional regulator
VSGPFEPGPTDSVGYQLWQAALRWQRVLGVALRPLDLTPTRFAVLGGLYWLTRDGRPARQAEVARQAGLDPVMTSKLVRALIEEGLVVRSADPDDSRAFQVTLTAAGSARAAEGVEALLATERDFFGGLGLDPHDLGRMLRRISGLSGPEGGSR